MSERPGFRNARKRHPFTQIANDALRDPELSWGAKGLLATMLTFADGWTYRMKHLETLSRQGRDATRTAMRELLQAGYVTRQTVQAEGGRMAGWSYTVSDYKRGPGDDAPEGVDLDDGPDDDTPEADQLPPSDGKPVGRSDATDGRVSGQSVEQPVGEPAAKKNKGKKINLKKSGDEPKTSAIAPTSAAERAHHFPPSQEETDKLIGRYLGGLRATLLEELPARRAWSKLPPEEIKAAAAAARTDQSGGVFATRLKAELDRRAKLDQPTSQAPAGGSTLDVSRARNQRLQQASDASEAAYDQALAAGRSPAEADVAAAAAYDQALTEPITAAA